MWIAPGRAPESRLTRHTQEQGLQKKLMWFDAEANIWELSTRDGVADTIGHCKSAGISAVIVDVKPLSGLALYNSEIAPRMVDFRGKPYPPHHDLLACVVELGHEAGIEVHAAVNVFSEGSRLDPGGPAFDHPDWQCVSYQDDGLKRTGEIDNVHGAIFVNPLHPEARAYELSIIKEICSNYAVDGIVLDRMRYPNINSDFSDLTRAEFEKTLGERVLLWPRDVYRRAHRGEIQRGRLFKHWLKFRAGVIRGFLSEARDVVKRSASGRTNLGVYVGSWYPMYYDVGVNWASPTHTADYDWWPSGYELTGYADLVDFLMTGCYYPHATRASARNAGFAEWRSVEAACEESLAAVEDATTLYASLYVREFESNPAEFAQSIRTCLALTQGCMLFDLVQIRDYGYWDLISPQ